MKWIFQVSFLGALLITIGSVTWAQVDSSSTIKPGDLEIYGKIFSKKDSLNSVLIPGARIDHMVSYLKQDVTTSESKGDSLSHVYYVTDNGEFYLVLEQETSNVLVFTSPGQYSKMIFISLEGSSQTEYKENMLMDMDVVLGKAKYRRVRKILENEFAGMGEYSSEKDDISWNDQYQIRIKEKISRPHWWWPWKIKD